MPLYETIVIGRSTITAQSANLMRAMAINIIKNGGNVRDISVLGDRILARNKRAKDKQRHTVGRYMQILFDGNVHVRDEAEKVAKGSYETLMCLTHKMNDYFSEAQLYKKTLRQKSLFVEENFRRRNYVVELNQILKEHNEMEKTSKINPAGLSKGVYEKRLNTHSTDLL